VGFERRRVAVSHYLQARQGLRSACRASDRYPPLPPAVGCRRSRAFRRNNDGIRRRIC
jgi:hypothetical protein